MEWGAGSADAGSRYAMYASCRVRRAYRYAPLPSEPCVRLSPYTAQANNLHSRRLLLPRISWDTLPRVELLMAVHVNKPTVVVAIRSALAFGL